MPKHKNWRREGTVIMLQRNGRTYAVDPENPDRVFEAICRFPNTVREYYDLKPVTGIDLTKELEKWKRNFSKC